MENRESSPTAPTTMQESLVSIVMPNFNRQKYIGEQMDSLLAQTYQNWELIIVDDCSTDGSEKIIEEFISNNRDKKITFLRNEETLGVAKNFEKGLGLATGKYVAVCDSDDVWFPDKLEKELRFLKKVNFGMVYSDLVVVDEKLQTIRKSFVKNFLSPFSNQKDDTFDELLHDNHITAPTILLCANLKDKLIPFSRHGMQDFWIALIFSMFSSIGYLDEQTIYYRQHSENVVGAKKFSFANLLFQESKNFLEDHTAMKKNSLSFFQDLLNVEGLKKEHVEKIGKKVEKIRLLVECLSGLKSGSDKFWNCFSKLWKLRAHRELLQAIYFKIF
jgi:glycosyltransferase involved in cell wall biosynthesis